MTVPVVGIQVFPGDGYMRPLDLGRAVEDRGFVALFFPEHLHMPVDRTIEFPIPIPLHPHSVAQNLQAQLRSLPDLRRHLGRHQPAHFRDGISLVAQRDPILLAKTIATLDHLCEGKFILGVGTGWNVEEMRNHGVDPGLRWSHVADHVRAMRTIWTEDMASYHGHFVNFDRI